MISSPRMNVLLERSALDVLGVDLQKKAGSKEADQILRIVLNCE
jgi:hypothetical protein